ncbi:MAG: hypothetical protein IJC88_05475 [Oscillospiraceae bacterium]|nr:hypothetical protein [Oscillospiraceae bacterium]
MKKHRNWMLACGLLVMVSVFAASLVLLLPPQETVGTPTLQVEEIPSSSGYVIKLHDGQIAVFDAARPDTPLRLTDIPATSLRHYDRELLTVGISVATEEELLMRLEDFGS